MLIDNHEMGYRESHLCSVVYVDGKISIRMTVHVLYKVMLVLCLTIYAQRRNVRGCISATGSFVTLQLCIIAL